MCTVEKCRLTIDTIVSYVGVLGPDISKELDSVSYEFLEDFYINLEYLILLIIIWF